MVLSDYSILERLAVSESDPRRLEISPFVDYAHKEPGVVGYGLQGFGYDVRLGNKFAAFQADTPSHVVIDPTNFPGEWVRWTEAAQYVVPPNSAILAETLEWLRIPEDVTAELKGKSTMARCHLTLTTTPLEPGWAGRVTIEIANLGSVPVLLRAGHGIGQVVFFQGDRPCRTPYNRKPGAAYQNQQGLTLPRV